MVGATRRQHRGFTEGLCAPAGVKRPSVWWAIRGNSALMIHSGDRVLRRFVFVAMEGIDE